MSLFYETKGKGFGDALNKKKKQTPQKTETKAPYKEQIPHFTEITPQNTAVSSSSKKSTSSSSSKSNSSSSKKSTSSKSSTSKAPYREELPSIFTINQRTTGSTSKNKSTTKSNRFTGSSAFGSTVFQPNTSPTAKRSSSSQKQTQPVKLYKNNGNPSFYNDYQMRSSTNKRFAPYASAFNKPKTIYDTINKATNNSVFSKKPDTISEKELTDEAKTYIVKGMETANVLDNSFVQGEKPGYYMSYEINSPIMRLALNSDQRTNELGNKDVVGFNAKDYMTEEELYTFYYINGRDGYAKSKEYVDSISDELKRRAFYDGSAVQNLQNVNPLVAAAATLGSSVISPGEGIATAIKSFRGETPDYTDNQNATAIRNLQKSADKIENPVGRVLAQAVIGTARNAPEMAVNFMGKFFKSKAISVIAGAILGADSSIADKYAEQIENGTVAVKGSTADIVAAGIIGGVEWGLMGEAISAPLLSVLKNAGAKSALKDFAVNTANSFLTGAGITVAQTTLENIADTIFLKDNSPYQQLAKDYIESGMSEQEAYNQAFKETYLAPLISSAAVGGLTGGLMSLPGNVSISADYTIRGRNIKQNGDFNNTIKQGLTYSRDTDAYKNAEKLNKKLTSGKLISDSELGAQDVLNNIEEQKTQLYAQAYEKLTGQKIYKVNDEGERINALNKNGEILISNDADEAAIDIIQHEGAHGIEQAAPERYAEYTNALRNQEGFSEYVDRLRQTYEDAGLKYNEKTLESEAAADFAKNFLKDTKSVEQLTKVAEQQTKLIDRVYNGINDLYARLKAKGGNTFVDENTGIKVTADELYKMKKSFETALLEARETGYNDGSVMYSVKQNYDAAKYGVKIDNELTSYLNDIGINKKIFKSADKSEIKDSIRQAYKSLDDGDIQTAEQILKDAGEFLTKKDPKSKKEDIPKQFAAKFISLYNSGKENNEKKVAARLNYQDKKDYNISVSGLVRNIIRSEKSYIDNDTAREISQSVRDAYSELKKGGNREEIIKSIIPETKKIAENARTKIADERAEFVLTQIRTANVDLSSFLDNQDANIREAYTELSKAFKSTKKGGVKLDSLYKELSSEYPEYFPKDVNSPEDILQKVNDVYQELRKGKTIPTYRDNEIETVARDMAEQIVDEYYNRQPAKETTEPKISRQDISKYGIDIETQFRNSGLNVDEGSIKRYSDYARKTIDDIVRSLNESIIAENFVDPAAKKYNDYAAEFNKTFDKIIGDSDIEPVQKQAVAARLMDTIWTASDNAISNIQRRAQDIISYYDISKKAPDGREITEAEYTKAKQVLKTCEYKTDEIKGLKLSKTYSNTGQKDFFKDEVKAEFEKRKKDFYYEGITNKETYESAERYIDINGREKTILSLTNKQNWTAEDMAKVAALVARYQSEGKYSDAADIYILAREKATNSGQVIQSMRLFDKLTPEGKLISFESDYNKAVDDQINSKADRDKIKEKIKEAKKKDAESRKDDENTETKRQQNLKKRSEISKEIEKNEKEIEKNEQNLKKADENLKKIKNNKKNIEKIQNEIKGVNKNNKKKIEELNKEIERMKKENSDLYEQFKKLKTEYDQKRPELEQKIQKNRELRNALKTLEKKYSKLNKKADKSILDVYTELDKVLDEAGIDHIPENILRYMRTSFAILPMLNDADTIADLIIDQSRIRKTAAGNNIKRALKKAAKRHGIEMLRETAYNQLFNMIGDFMPHSMWAKTGFVYRAAMLINPTTLIRNILSNFVFTPVETFVNNMAVPIDMFVSLFEKQRSIGFEMPFTGYINGVRRAQLSRLEQALKVNNLLNSGNEYASSKRKLYSKAGSAVERVMGYGLSTTDEFQKGIVEQRTRKNLERINKRYSKQQEIIAEDPESEAVKRMQKSIFNLHKYGYSPEDLDEVVQYEMLYRTFQDDTALSRALKGLQETGNKILGNEHFGLGDVIIPYTQVPGNIISRSIEYSPLGYFKFISNIAKVAAENHKSHSRLTPAQQRKIILSFTRPTTALGLMAAGALLRHANIILGNSINKDEEYDYTNYQKAKGISDFLINLSAIQRLIKGESTKAQDGDEMMDIGWLTPLNATFALGASLYDTLSPNVPNVESVEDLKDLPMNTFNAIKADFNNVFNNIFNYGVEQAKDLPALTGIYQIIQNWENVNEQILPFLVAQGTDIALGFIPQVVKKVGNVMDTETRYPYKEEDPYQIAIGKIYSALPFMKKRSEVPKKVDVFGEEVKSTLGETWKDIVNEYIAPGKFSKYQEKDIVPELDRLLQYSSDILPESPYTENSTTIDGVKYSFTVKGKDYEEYSKLLGTLTYDNISAFMGSEFYQYLSDNQRVENLSDIVSESKTLAKQIWVKASQGASIDEINEMKAAKIAEYKAIPAYTVKERQAKDYLMSDAAPVETIVDAYVKRYSTDWTEEEKNKKIQEYQKRINDIKAGKRYKEINGKRVYSRNWSEELKQSEIQKAQDSIDKINNGETYKQEDITGVWSSLDDEQKQQILKNLEKNIEELELPEAAISTIPDMSKEDYYTESTNTGIQDFENKSALYETRFTSDNIFKPTDNFKAESTDTPSQYDLAYIADKANEYAETETSTSPQKYSKSRYSGSSSGSNKSSGSSKRKSSGGSSSKSGSGSSRSFSIASLLNTPRFTPRSATKEYVMPGENMDDGYFSGGIQVASAQSYRPRFTPSTQIFTGASFPSDTRFPDRFNRA